ncbi:MAG: hypothetical protein SF339_12775 [Blastocatellia bacterium]|nr:hypothetical protein [Blastocatellia bacterium]
MDKIFRIVQDSQDPVFAGPPVNPEQSCSSFLVRTSLNGVKTHNSRNYRLCDIAESETGFKRPDSSSGESFLYGCLVANEMRFSVGSERSPILRFCQRLAQPARAAPAASSDPDDRAAPEPIASGGAGAFFARVKL